MTERTDLVGRSRELDLTARFVQTIADGPRALVIAGVAGIGKTAIWQWGSELARAEGYAVLTARPAEDEMLTALLGLADLVDGSAMPDDLLDRPDGGQTDTAWTSATMPGAGGDAVHRGRRMLSEIRSLSKEQPILVAIDDLQWLDADSARALRYVFRRIDRQRVGLLATWRTTATSEPPPDPLSIDHRLVDRMNLGPLSQNEIRRMLSSLRTSVSPLTLRSIHSVAGGNPLYAIEITRSLTTEEQQVGLAPDAGLPRSLSGAIGQRLAEVGPRVTAILQLIAVAGPMPLSRVEAQIAESWAGVAIEEARRLGLLEMAPNLRLQFGHPLLASGVLESINPLDLRRMHATLADVEPDPGLRARHLALSTDEADEGVAAQLESRADAVATTSPAQAAEFARHAHRLTPPAEAGAALRRKLLEAKGLGAAGEGARASRMFDELLGQLEPGPLRAEVLIQRFYVDNDDVDRGDELLVAALEAARDPVLRGRILDLLGWHRGVFRGDLVAGLAAADEAVALLATTDDDSTLMWARGHRAHMRALTGHPEPDLMREAVAHFGKRRGRDMGGGPAAWLAKQDLWSGDPQRALAELDTVIANYNERGFTIGLPWRAYDLALTRLAIGDLAGAGNATDDGLDLARDVGVGDVEGWLCYPKALVAAWRGDADEAMELADRLENYPGRLAGSVLADIRAANVRGTVHLADGRPSDALEALVPAVEAAEACGLAHPGAVPTLPNAAIAAAWSGDGELAARFVTLLAAQSERLGVPRVDAQTMEARGVTVGVDKDPDAGAKLVTRAAERFEALHLAPDAARAILNHGRILLKAGRRNVAAEVLAEAHHRFEAMGAASWAKQAAQELDRAQPRRSDGGLTDQEQRIAALVAEGSTNKQIAATLFISVATVEAHLTRLYRKLQIRRRTELSRMVLDGTLELSDRSENPQT